MAIRKSSPFKSTGRKNEVKTPPIPNDEVSITERRRARKKTPELPCTLLFRFQTTNPARPFYERDFTRFVENYPAHILLIRQLLAAMPFTNIGKSPSAYQSYQQHALAIEDFVTFVHSDEPKLKNISCIADITFSTAKSFSAWLIRTQPGRSCNRKRYQAIRQSVCGYQKKHGDDPHIGNFFEWPPAPGSVEKVTESYPESLFNQMVDRCLFDMEFVIQHMSSFFTTIGNVKPFEDFDGIWPQTHHSVWSVTGNLTRTESELMAYATAQIMYPSWPMDMPLEEAIDTLSHKTPLEDSELAKTRAHRVLISSRFGPDDNPFCVGQLAYFSHFAFTGNTLYPFFLYVMLNTGWNQESILALTDNLNDHIEEDLIDEHYCIIYSTKGRTKKAVSHRTNKKSPYGVYRVLRFVESQIIKYKSSQHYIHGSLWQFVVTKNMWPRTGRPTATINDFNLPGLSRSFIERNKLEMGQTANKPGIESRKIRTTYLTRRREHGLSTEAMSTLMEHSDLDTTAIHYDSDSGSNKFKNRRIRELQDKHLEDFTHYSARLIENATLQDLRKAVSENRNWSDSNVARTKKLTKNDIIHLISPRGQTYIAACADAKNPSWPNAQDFLSPGEDCRFFNRCCLCDKAIIFKESLPWIARRISDLEKLRENLASADWTANYLDEIQGWESILTNWNNKKEVKAANNKAKDAKYSLPLTMRGT